MKRLIFLGSLVFIGTVGWQLGEKLSPDAVSMALGIFFGVLASIPTALLILAAGRQPGGGDHAVNHRQQGSPQQAESSPHAPVIVVAPPVHGYPQMQGRGAVHGYLPGSGDITSSNTGTNLFNGTPRQRQFKVVGEEEAWLDEF